MKERKAKNTVKRREKDQKGLQEINLRKGIRKEAMSNRRQKSRA